MYRIMAFYRMKHYTTVLTIAGSDSGGGAGIQADIKTISALGCYATTAITAITVQNTVGVEAVHPVPVDFVKGQIEAVLSDIGADAVKIGMLQSAEIVRAVAEMLRKYKVGNVVLDPVMVSTSGHRLIEEEAIDTLRRELIPLAPGNGTAAFSQLRRVCPAQSRASFGRRTDRHPLRQRDGQTAPADLETHPHQEYARYRLYDVVGPRCIAC